MHRAAQGDAAVLDTYQLQTFLAVAETGSFTAAARRLHLTQPAVSRQIQLLQEHLGVRLFRRAGRRMLLTHAGERLLETARQVTRLAQRAEEEMALLRGEVTGRLRIGGTGSPAWHVLARLLPAFRAAYPAVVLQLEPLPPGQSSLALRDGPLDLIVGEEPAQERGLSSILLQGMETVLVAPPEPRWEQRKRLPLRKISDLPLILPAQGSPPRNFLEEVFRSRQILLPVPPRALEVADPGMALPLVAAGLGAALFPHPVLEITRAPVHLIALWPSFSWTIYLVHRSRPLSQAEEAFVRFVEEQGRVLVR
jgi:DNA-binding transcriptional LysR family regulator